MADMARSGCQGVAQMTEAERLEWGKRFLRIWERFAKNEEAPGK